MSLNFVSGVHGLQMPGLPSPKVVAKHFPTYNIRGINIR